VPKADKKLTEEKLSYRFEEEEEEKEGGDGPKASTS